MNRTGYLLYLTWSQDLHLSPLARATAAVLAVVLIREPTAEPAGAFKGANHIITFAARPPPPTSAPIAITYGWPARGHGLLGCTVQVAGLWQRVPQIRY